MHLQLPFTKRTEPGKNWPQRPDPPPPLHIPSIRLEQGDTNGRTKRLLLAWQWLALAPRLCCYLPHAPLPPQGSREKTLWKPEGADVLTFFRSSFSFPFIVVYVTSAPELKYKVPRYNWCAKTSAAQRRVERWRFHCGEINVSSLGSHCSLLFTAVYKIYLYLL